MSTSSVEPTRCGAILAVVYCRMLAERSGRGTYRSVRAIRVFPYRRFRILDLPAKRNYQKQGNATPNNSRRPSLGISVQRSRDGSEWMFNHPRCVRQRAEDVEEVRTMIEKGETDVAIDELRWLVDGCREFIDAHRMLGELVLS
jgi:hypothetical protein